MITIRNLHKYFGKLEVINGVDLDIAEGEVVVIIGPSGTGKSTLLRCVNYLEKPNEGIIRIGDVEVEAKTATSENVRGLRNQSAMVFQNYNLFKNMTVLDNVKLHLELVKKLPAGEAKKKAQMYLELVHLSDKVSEYPSRLSGGQQQRVAIARAMAVEPKIILFDEPTAALDPSLTGEVMDVIRDLAKRQRTMLIVTHSMLLARDVADKVIFMDSGNIIEQGSPAELFDSPKDSRLKEFLKVVKEQ